MSAFDGPSSNKLQLQIRLLELVMQPGSSVDNYFKDLQDITDRLAAMNAPVDQDIQVAVLLRGLPAEYESLRTAYVSKGVVTLGELREALKTEERRVCNSDSASTASVLEQVEQQGIVEVWKTVNESDVGQTKVSG